MGFELERDTVVIEDQEFEIVREKSSGKAYFANRVELKGTLDFGVVTRNNTSKISLKDNHIFSPIIIDSIVALSGKSTADEIFFDLYKIIDGKEIKVGTQRYSSGQMPLDFPDGIIYPDMIVAARPTRADATIQVTVKPVIHLFTAVPNPQTL